MPPVLSHASRRDGHNLATQHVLGPSDLRGREVRARLRRLDRRFARFFQLSGQEEKEQRSVSLGGRVWLIENDFVVGEALESLDRALPSNFLKALPGLVEPASQRGVPRAEALARELVRRGRGRVEVEEIVLFLEGYQEVRSLRLAELWALPSFLRLALLDELIDQASGDDELVELGPYILSLRTLAGEDWRDVVESLSLVDRVLRKDPAGVYAHMDFRTRDRYRTRVEWMAGLVKQPEDMIARKAVELAQQHNPTRREGHVGYYLVEAGREDVVEAFGGRIPFSGVPAGRRLIAGWTYFGGIAAATIAMLDLFDIVMPHGPWLWPFLLLALIPSIGVAVAIANRVAGQFMRPRALPRLDVRKGIPDRFRTVVAVPALLTSRDEIDDVLRQLETNYQANPDPALSFALLSDFPDADRERVAGDDSLLNRATEGIRRLNRLYVSGDASGPFLLLHRPRRWNPSEGRWMGWERKRGKLIELNRLLLGHPTSLWVVAGHADRLEGIPFVLTVDADTRLPRDSAARLVGTLAHPLNRPEIGIGGRITRGYSVLQPRIEILPDADGGTAFSRVFGGVQGLDLYARAAFDVYQDLFDVGIFAGKGIYDVRAFEASLTGRTPENTLLSHDLFEGVHGRAGLVSDLVLLEDFPSHPLAYARRAHRWIRGDWQILPWLFPSVPAERGERRKNRLPPLARWMIFDNLRRSLQPPAMVALLLTGWILFPASATAWTLLLVAIVGIPFLTGTVDAALRAGKEVPRRADVEAESRALRRAFGRWALDLTLLPFEAGYTTDAIVRTLNRVFFSRRRLLEWRTAALTARDVRGSDSVAAMLRGMWYGPALAIAVAASLLVLHGQTPILPGILLSSWVASPWIAHAISRSRRPLREPRGELPRVEARALARRIWGFFERFQGPERSWLVPDHYQEDPGQEIAERTSPTNIGMSLVSTVSAWDLGFVSTPRMIVRIGSCVEGLRGLTRYRGHFLNWYDTSSLEPLHPLYVSTVDSGNLAAAFVVTREALAEAGNCPLWTEATVEGLVDTLRVVWELLEASEESGAAQSMKVEIRALETWMNRYLRDAWRDGLGSFVKALEELRDRELPGIERHLLRIEDVPGVAVMANAWDGVHAWVAHLRADTEQLATEIIELLPWLGPRFRDADLLSGVPVSWASANGEAPTLVTLCDVLARFHGPGSRPERLPEALRGEVAKALDSVQTLLRDTSGVASVLESWYEEMDFAFLYDDRRDLFRIGFSISTGELDPSHYDLLASEARIASTVAMSKGEAPPSHWLHLGRPFTRTNRGPVLLSWSGTMFEYLMPAIFLRMPPESVLEEACRRAVDVQRDYGRKMRVPWGISESGYHVLSSEGHYQYRAFGVPALGLNRSGSTRLVVAPYASLMAVPLAPGAAHRNLEHLRALDAIGPWGPYEALDFGPTAQRSGTPRIVRSYMSHHQGMILSALGNYLTSNRLVERFHRNPRIATVEPYLYERIPWRRAVERKWVDRSTPGLTSRAIPGIRSWSPSIRRSPPPLHHLASGDLVSAMGVDGRGGLRWGKWSIVRGGIGAGVARGGPDLVLMDRDSGASWSPMPDPLAEPDQGQWVLFEPHRAEFMRKSRGIRARMEVLLPPGTGVEVRELSFTNESSDARSLRLALSSEMALAPTADDQRHPAFHKLFVRANVLSGGDGIVFERRPRSPDEEPPTVLVSILALNGEPAGTDGKTTLHWGTSRESFLGRGRGRYRPAALDDPGLCAAPEGPHHPLDPMAAAILDLDLGPWEERSFTVLLAVGPDRDTVIQNASELRFPRRREWAHIQARSRAEGELVRLGASAEDPMIWEELLAQIVHPRGMERVGVTAAAVLDLRQSSLWRWGISGDVPYVLVEGETERASEVLQEVVRAQSWWRRRGEIFDLVVVNQGRGEYYDLVRDRVTSLLSSVGSSDAVGVSGGVHLVGADDLGDEERIRLRALAALRLDAASGSLRTQLSAVRTELQDFSEISSAASAPRLVSGMGGAADVGDEGSPIEPLELVVPSSLGGFDPETDDYVVELPPGETTPAPWVNILAGESIGSVVTESGGSFTWFRDAGEFRLTPWHNDPVLGLRGEAIYLKDEDTGRVWTPTPGPIGLHRAHRMRHGWGRSVLTSASVDGLDEEVSWYLHPSLPVKVVRIRVRNESRRPRRLSSTFFADWVLGTDARGTSGRLQVRFDDDLGAVVARNPFSLEFSDHVAFLAADRTLDGVTTDRHEFLGPAGPLDRIPEGLRGRSPDDPTIPRGRGCGVLKRNLTLKPGETGEICFFLGAVDRVEDLPATLRHLKTHDATNGVASAAHRGWADYLDRVRVRTPEPGLDQLVNGWLPYQTIASRLRGRTGFYQSGGAFGFRDQLQDVYTLLPLDPELAKAHLEEAARRQFVEGDVLHWWHPDETRGVRTRCSDDLLWLPWVLAQTVRWTGDRDLLDRSVPYLTGPTLDEETDENYDAFPVSQEVGTLWDHAVRAIEHTASLLSPRGLPLMGTGDWNDGMNLVGEEGRGESIWLGWFFLDACRLMLPLARERGDDRVAMRLEDWSTTVREAIEIHGWDGAWYRRAFFDNGEPLGSRESAEARIDSIAQSWGVLSGAADPQRAKIALESAWRELVRMDDGIAALLTPAFTGAGPNPGYIAAYAPGVRENGGQYTHAASWLLRALARQGNGERVGALLRLLLPTRHAAGEGTKRYRVEPYVFAADVYAVEPHVGRGGWTWYTGSAGWIWRVVLEDVLGVSREGDRLILNPCIPSEWDGFEVSLKVEHLRVLIRVENPGGATNGISECTVDGIEVNPRSIPIFQLAEASGSTPGEADPGGDTRQEALVIEALMGVGRERDRPERDLSARDRKESLDV